MHSRSVNALVKEKRNRIEFELTESVYKRAKCERALYVMKNALNHFNTIVPLITLIMCYFVLKELVY